MFYFTCNESRIYESFTFWNKLQKKELLAKVKPILSSKNFEKVIHAIYI